MTENSIISGAELKARRIARSPRTPQAEAARLCHVNTDTYRSYEQNRRTVPVKVARISQKWNISKNMP